MILTAKEMYLMYIIFYFVNSNENNLMLSILTNGSGEKMKF